MKALTFSQINTAPYDIRHECGLSVLWSYWLTDWLTTIANWCLSNTVTKVNSVSPGHVGDTGKTVLWAAAQHMPWGGSHARQNSLLSLQSSHSDHYIERLWSLAELKFFTKKYLKCMYLLFVTLFLSTPENELLSSLNFKTLIFNSKCQNLTLARPGWEQHTGPPHTATPHVCSASPAGLSHQQLHLVWNCCRQRSQDHSPSGGSCRGGRRQYRW